MYYLIFLFLLVSPSVQGGVVPLKDNLLFGFEKCKSLSVDLQQGQLKEAVSSSFDLHCRKLPEKKMDFTCSFFPQGSSEKTSESVFTGGSELGEGELKDQKGRRIKFLIGKGFASFADPEEHKLCAGIFIFEAEARKQKTQ